MAEIMRLVRQESLSRIAFYKPRGHHKGYAVIYTGGREKPWRVFRIRQARRHSKGGLVRGELLGGVPRIVRSNFANAIKHGDPIFLGYLSNGVPVNGSPVHVVNVRKYRFS